MPQPFSILVVDDESGPRAALKAILEPEFAVRAFSGGSEALNYVQAHPGEIHAAFVDFSMPEMDGKQVCDSLSEIDETMRLVGFTGHDSADFGSRIFALLKKRGVSPQQIREIAWNAVKEAVRLKTRPA